jgi:hypothetical protein
MYEMQGPRRSRVTSSHAGEPAAHTLRVTITSVEPTPRAEPVSRPAGPVSRPFAVAPSCL